MPKSINDQIQPRGLRIKDAAAYCGLKPGTFRKIGPAPIKIGRCLVWDRNALDHWLDELSGHSIAKGTPTALAEAEALRAINDFARRWDEYKSEEARLLADMQREEAIATAACADAGGSKTAIYEAGADVRRKFKAKIKAIRP